MGVKIARGPLAVPDFRRLWLADAVSQLGNRIDVLAVPLLAATVLGASAFEVSLLRTAQTLPYLVLGLQVGAWCDRMRHRPVLIAADAGRAVLVASVPVAALAGVLGLPHLLVVVLGVGLLGVFFDITHQTYVPRLVPRELLPAANSRLATNLSAAAVAGPALAGLLVQAAGATAALAADAASYVWSALWLRRIETPDERPDRAGKPRLRREIADGLRAVRGDRILLAVCAHGAVSSLFQSAHLAIVVVFLLRDVGLSPATIGLLSTSTLTGALAAGLTARRLGAWLGTARILWAAGLLFGVAYQLFPLTSPGWGLICYVVAGFGSSFSVIVLNVFMTSYQQAATPPELLGRVNAISRTLVFGVAPVGSLLGGVLAEVIGLRPTLAVAAAGTLAASALLVCSPLRKLRDLPS